MPIYEYVCQSCGFEKDALQKMSDAPLTECPQCGKDTFVKKISAPGFRLSGTGWYETDFKTGKKKNLAGESGSTSSESSAAKQSSSESKSSASSTSGNSAAN